MADEDETNHFLDAISGYTEAEYTGLLKRLSAFTRRIVASGEHVWSGIRGGSLPKGMTVEDIVCGVIVDAIAGKLRWNKAKNATEFKFLCSRIAGRVSNLAGSAENMKTVTVRPPDPEGDDQEPLDHLLVCPESSPSERLAATEFLEKFRSWLKSKGKDDEDLEYLIMAMEDGTATRAEIARTLSIPPRDVDNMRKRLERRLAEFRKGAKS